MVVVTPFFVTEGHASPCSQRHFGLRMRCHIMLKLWLLTIYVYTPSGWQCTARASQSRPCKPRSCCTLAAKIFYIFRLDLFYYMYSLGGKSSWLPSRWNRRPPWTCTRCPSSCGRPGTRSGSCRCKIGNYAICKIRHMQKSAIMQNVKYANIQICNM